MATQKTYKINIDVESKTLGQLEDDLSKINDELKDVDRNSEAFKTLSKQAQVLNKEIDKTNQTIEGFTLDKKLEAADGAAKVFAGSLSAVVGTLGVLGVESEVFGKFEEKAASAIAVGLGIKDVSEGFSKLTKTVKLQTIAQKALNVVQGIYNAIMSANPVALVILSIATLIGLVISLKDKFEAVNKVFNFFKGLVNSVAEALGLAATEEEKAALRFKEATEQRILDIENEIKVRKAAGESIVKLERERLNAVIALTKEETQERKDAMADLAAFEAQLVKEKEDREAAAAEKAKQERQKELEEFESISEKLNGSIETQGVVALKVKSANDQLKDSVKGIVPAMGAADKATQKQTGALLSQQFQEDENRASMAATGQALGQLGAVLDQESTAAKGLAISSAIINTYLGVTEALKQKSVLPSPFDVITKIANVATILATGFKTVSAIKSTPSKSGGGAAPASISSGGGSRGIALAAPQELPQFDAPQTFDNTAPTVKAYVVSGDVRRGEEVDAKIQRRRTID